MPDTYLVTGATGLVGSALVRALRDRGDDVICLVRDTARAAARFSDLADGLTLRAWDARRPITYDGPADFVVHAAGPTGSRFFVDHPTETITSIVAGTWQVLDWARSRPIRALAYLSSVEVYGTPDSAALLDESALGYLDPLEPRATYPQAKRLAESLCVAFARQFATPARIIRLASVVGPPVDPVDDRFIAQALRAAAAGRPIRLATDGRSERSHIAVDDAISAILAVLQHGADGQAYNAAHEAAFCSIRAFAEAAARASGGQSVVMTGAAADSGQYLTRRAVNLDAARLRALGWTPQFDLDRMLERALRQMPDDPS
jgi:nucleoside-diphosphate-sugar epimerase